MDPRIEVVFADGTSESFVLDKDEIILGRAVDANIAIPDGRELEPQHLLLRKQADGCWVAVAQGAQTATLVSGKAFQSGVLPWGTEIQIGPFVVVLTGEELAKKKNELGPWILGLVILGAAFGGFIWFKAGGGANAVKVPREYPEIIPAPVACSVPAAAEARGKTAFDAALAKSDRFLFDPQDGIQAIALYSEAQACFSRAGQTALAGRAQREGATMQTRVKDSYLAHRLAFERAVEPGQENWEVASQEIGQLYRFVDHVNDERGIRYKTDLLRINTQVVLYLAAKEKKK
jgi:hypothetical protein